MASRFTHQIMRWLIIALISLSVFVIILLGLGYLLYENEKEVIALKAQLELQAQRVSQPQQNAVNSEMRVDIVSASNVDVSAEDMTNQYQQQLQHAVDKARKLDQIKQAIVENLVCQSVAQCRLVDTASIDLGCVVAVNSIGESKLAKFNFAKRDIACEERVEDVSLTCHHNICSIK